MEHQRLGERREAWTRKADLGEPRNAPTVSVYASGVFAPQQPTVFIVGGYNLETKTVLNTVEAWDYLNDVWKVVSSVPSVVAAILSSPCACALW